jgi:hypothetical protein
MTKPNYSKLLENLKVNIVTQEPVCKTMACRSQYNVTHYIVTSRFQLKYISHKVLHALQLKRVMSTVFGLKMVHSTRENLKRSQSVDLLSRDQRIALHPPLCVLRPVLCPFLFTRVVRDGRFEYLRFGREMRVENRGE